MDRTRQYHIKWSKSETQRQIPHGITYIWELKYDTDELCMKQKQTQA